MKRLGLIVGTLDPWSTEAFRDPESNERIVERAGAEKRLADLAIEYQNNPPKLSAELREKLGLSAQK